MCEVGVQLPGLTGMEAHSGRFTANGPDGKDCGEGTKERVGMGVGGGGGLADASGSVIEEFIAEEKTPCVLESGEDSLAGAVLPAFRGEPGGHKDFGGEAV